MSGSLRPPAEDCPPDVGRPPVKTTVPSVAGLPADAAPPTVDPPLPGALSEVSVPVKAAASVAGPIARPSLLARCSMLLSSCQRRPPRRPSAIRGRSRPEAGPSRSRPAGRRPPERKSQGPPERRYGTPLAEQWHQAAASVEKLWSQMIRRRGCRGLRPRAVSRSVGAAQCSSFCFAGVLSTCERRPRAKNPVAPRRAAATSTYIPWAGPLRAEKSMNAADPSAGTPSTQSRKQDGREFLQIDREFLQIDPTSNIRAWRPSRRTGVHRCAVREPALPHEQ
jgi:hypothetical protein